MTLKIIGFLFLVTYLYSGVTMCYIKDHSDPSTVESTPLQGVECKGIYSVNDMKKLGYEVENLKIQNNTRGLDYIYIFKKKSLKPTKVVASSNNMQQDVKKALKKIEKEKQKPNLQNGKVIYNSKCRLCHEDGSVSAYNTARPLNELTVEQITTSIRDYDLEQKDNGMAFVMRPYANLLSPKDLKDVAAYIQTLKDQ
jgi:cytochrome c553